MVEPIAYTIERAAEALGVSEATVRRLIDDRAIPFVRLRGNVRVPVSALTTWLDEQALAAIKEQAVTEFVMGGREPTVIGLGSRRNPREKKRAAVGSSDGSSGVS